MKKILFIPPQGKLKTQDFSIQRIVKYMNSNKYQTTLLHIKSPYNIIGKEFFNKIIEVIDEKELFNTINYIEYDYIFHRSWMHSYEFAKKLIQNYNNVILNIKDWTFTNEDIYKFLFNNNDFESIKYIFKHANLILSHYTNNHFIQLEKDFYINKENCMFFPEYCNKESFNFKRRVLDDQIKLVYAGKILSTSYPEEYFSSKSQLHSIKEITKQNISIDFVIPDIEFIKMQENKLLFQDFFFEEYINNKFHIKKGEALNPIVLNDYHFGFFELEANDKDDIFYNYAITSKFAFYLEAQLPLLVNEKFKSIAKIVKKHNLGIVFSNKDLKNLYSILQVTNKQYKEYLKNISIFRKKYIYTDQIFESVFNSTNFIKKGL